MGPAERAEVGALLLVLDRAPPFCRRVVTEGRFRFEGEWRLMDLWTPLAVAGVVVEVLVVEVASLGDEPSGLVRASRPGRELKGGDGLDEFLRLVELLKDWR